MKLSEIVVTSEEFASLFEKSRRTVETWKREGMPHLKRGIPLFEAVRWWRSERFKEMDELRGARTRRETAKAKIAELDAKEREGSLLPREVPIKWLSLVVSEAKQAFLNLPRRLGPVLAPMGDEKEVELKLREEIYSILRELAKPVKDSKKEGRK
jgi:phage terminase Nu1 subunit (DNA packaging protein)